MQDTFYCPESDALLRTHTSPVQIRTMLAQQAAGPRSSRPGAVYRRDADTTHSPMFHQVEGLVVDEGVTLRRPEGHAACLRAGASSARDSSMRLRPSFFPVHRALGRGRHRAACSAAARAAALCKQTGWLEILGAGMVHPRCSRHVGLRPREVTGFAFGMGIERMAMLRYGIDDIRLFFENDVRFLRAVLDMKISVQLAARAGRPSTSTAEQAAAPDHGGRRRGRVTPSRPISGALVVGGRAPSRREAAPNADKLLSCEVDTATRRCCRWCAARRTTRSGQGAVWAPAGRDAAERPEIKQARARRGCRTACSARRRAGPRRGARRRPAHPRRRRCRRRTTSCAQALGLRRHGAGGRTSRPTGRTACRHLGVRARWRR